MKTLLLLLLTGIVATRAKEERSYAYVYEVRVWDQPSCYGNYRALHDAVPDLDDYNYDNTIASVSVKGVWIFYDMPYYNTSDPAYVYYSWGLDYQETCNDGMLNQVSSLRYAGSQTAMNEDGFNLYEGVSFTKKEFYGNHDIPDMTKYHEEAVSIIIIGGSSWTFCEHVNYSGHCACLHSNQYDSSHYERLDVGFFPDIHASQVGIYSVRSVRKGCYQA